MYENGLHFFLGAYTPRGFVSEFKELQNPKKLNSLFCIEGAPGCGKSTMIKRVVREFSQYDIPYIFHCAFSPSSLGAVYFPALKFAVADATYPHAVTPKSPLLFESIVSLYDCCDSIGLSKYREPLDTLSQIKERNISSCRRFLAAAGSLLSDTYLTALDFTDREKITRLVNRIFRKHQRSRPVKKGRELNFFMSAIVREGVLTYPENIKNLCRDVYTINDNCGAVSRIFMKEVRKAALENGFDIISCRCPTAPLDKIDHIFIPKLSLGFITSNRFHPLKENAAGKSIDFRSFTTDTPLKKDRFQSIEKAVLGIFDGAAQSLFSAGAAHEQIENIYLSLTDFDRVNRKSDELMYRIKTSLFLA